jgi:hypothetical protein
MRTFMKWSKASGSDRRKVERIIRLGDRATKRTLSAIRRREFSERLDYAN